jgi:hypothetical protein
MSQMQQYDRGSHHSPSAHPRAGTIVRSPSQAIVRCGHRYEGIAYTVV